MLGFSTENSVLGIFVPKIFSENQRSQKTGVVTDFKEGDKQHLYLPSQAWQQTPWIYHKKQINILIVRPRKSTCRLGGRRTYQPTMMVPYLSAMVTKI